MPTALELVISDCGSQSKELSVSAHAFVLDTFAFSIRPMVRSLALEAVGVRIGLVVCV